MKVPHINSHDLSKTFFCQPSILFIHSADLTVGEKKDVVTGPLAILAGIVLDLSVEITIWKPPNQPLTPLSLLDPKHLGEL